MAPAETPLPPVHRAVEVAAATAPPAATAVPAHLASTASSSAAPEHVESLSPARQLAIQHAIAYADAADAVLASARDAPGGPVLTLYREAIYWLLVQDGTGGVPLVAAFEATPPALLEKAAGGRDNLARLRTVLAMHAFIASADLSRDEQLAIAQIARRFVHALLNHITGKPTRDARARIRRRNSLLVVVALAVLCGVVALNYLGTAPTNLAKGKPWRTSSVSGGPFPPNLIFHTGFENSPWFEIDLEKSMSVQGVRIRNRSDCCGEKAIPLVVELSMDRQRWQEVARMASAFTVWNPSFTSVTARYVRARVDRESVLHLEEVQIF